MEHFTDSIKTVGKMVVPTVAGVASTFSEWEPIFRMASLFITTTLSVIIFYHNYHKDRPKKNEKEAD